MIVYMAEIKAVVDGHLTPFESLPEEAKQYILEGMRAGEMCGELYIANPPALPFNPTEEDYVSLMEEMGWSVSKDSDGLYISQFSPAGEDFGFNIPGIDIPAEVASMSRDFDVDEHVLLWCDSLGKRGVPSSARALVEDAEAIDAMLTDLANALNQ